MTRKQALETYRAIHEARRTLETAGVRRVLKDDEQKLVESLKATEVLLVKAALSS